MNRCLVLFDGDCGFCNGTVRFLLRRDRAEALWFVPSRSEAGAVLMARYHLDAEAVARSVYAIGAHGVAAQSAAFLQIARRLPYPWRAASGLRLVPAPLRDALYRWVARNRSAFSPCAVGSPKTHPRLLETAAALDTRFPPSGSTPPNPSP